jgi:hypothetical protein
LKTLHGAGIAQKIRELSDNVRGTVSIVSPYIGRWPAVCAILGGNWWLGSPVALRIIADTSSSGNVNSGTLKRLMDRGRVRSLLGVHAKVYIFDDQAVVTSANLTETGFTKRYEIGIYLDRVEAEETITRFNSWWDTSGNDLTEQDISSWPTHQAAFAEESEGTGLKPLWSLPEKPTDTFFNEPDQARYKKFKSFQTFIASYKELARGYSEPGRLWPSAPLFLEVDSFLNYLFHEAAGQPSLEFYESKEPRFLSPRERDKEIAKYALNFKSWAAAQPGERWREEYARLIHNILAKDRIDSITIEEVKQVVDRLNCMNARQLNKYKFLQPHNNSLNTIRSSWKALLFGGDPVEKRMQKCDDSLHSFGPSSVQELLGWYYPGEFPIRNNNSDAGLRFLGFRI